MERRDSFLEFFTVNTNIPEMAMLASKDFTAAKNATSILLSFFPLKKIEFSNDLLYIINKKDK